MNGTNEDEKSDSTSKRKEHRKKTHVRSGSETNTAQILEKPPQNSVGFLETHNANKAINETRSSLSKSASYSDFSKGRGISLSGIFSRSKKTERVELNSIPPDLLTTLNNPSLYASFEQFLADEFALENLHFIEEAEIFCETEDDKIASFHAREIYEKYVKEKGKEEINISGDLKIKLKEIIFSETHSIPPTLFEPIITQVRTLINDNFFSRWITKGEWKYIEFSKYEPQLVSLKFILNHFRLRNMFFEFVSRLGKDEAIAVELFEEIITYESLKENFASEAIRIIYLYFSDSEIIDSTQNKQLSVLSYESLLKIVKELQQCVNKADSSFFYPLKEELRHIFDKEYYKQWILLKQWIWVRVSEHSLTKTSFEKKKPEKRHESGNQKRKHLKEKRLSNSVLIGRKIVSKQQNSSAGTLSVNPLSRSVHFGTIGAPRLPSSGVKKSASLHENLALI